MGVRVVELTEDDRAHIAAVFFEEIVPKLELRNARVGALGCGFAGERYQNWLLLFRESGPGFEILDYEYDEDARAVALVP